MSVELISKGVQDVYLTSNPEVSFFRQSYKRHTNFSQKLVQIDPMGTLAPGQEVSIKIPNKGDLLGYVWVDLGAANCLLSDGTVCGINADSDANPCVFELWVGGQLVDRQDSVYMVQYWNKYLVDCGAKATACAVGLNGMDDILHSTWLPLHFFFCDALYLPLVALQYHEVEIRIKFPSGSYTCSQLKFYANYVMLDTDERAALVNKEQEYLIEQVQKIYFNGARADLSLLNHPVKCLLWGNADSTDTIDSATTVQLYLNGTETFNTPMPDKFFKQVQGYYHSEIGTTPLADPNDTLRMYSFALKANKHQPCGTCNFSRLDNASLLLSIPLATGAPLYAVNYNIFRIKNGLGGVAFSN